MKNKKLVIIPFITIIAIIFIVITVLFVKSNDKEATFEYTVNYKEIDELIEKYNQQIEKDTSHALIVTNDLYNYESIKKNRPFDLVDIINNYVIQNDLNERPNYDGASIIGEYHDVVKYDKKTFEKLYKEFWNKEVSYDEMKKLYKEEIDDNRLKINDDTLEFKFDITGNASIGLLDDIYNVIEVTKKNDGLIVKFDYIALDDEYNVYKDVSKKDKITKDEELDFYMSIDTAKEQVENYLKKYDKDKGIYEMTFDKVNDTYAFKEVKRIK